MQKEWVDPDDAPVFTGDELLRPDAKWQIGGKEVSSQEGKAAVRVRLRGKSRINTHVDNDLIAHYKAVAGSRGYQTLINAALRRDVEGAELKAELMKALDERFATLTSLLSQQITTPTVWFATPAVIWSGVTSIGLPCSASSAAPAVTNANTQAKKYDLTSQFRPENLAHSSSDAKGLELESLTLGTA